MDKVASSATTNPDCEDASLSDDDDNDKSLCEVKESVDYLASHFRLPLEAKGVVIATLQDEVEEAVEFQNPLYTKMISFLNILKDSFIPNNLQLYNVSLLSKILIAITYIAY